MTGVWIESRRRCASETERERGRERVTEAEKKQRKSESGEEKNWVDR